MAITTGNEFKKAAPAHRVYVRQNWAGTWIEVEHLFCLQAVHSMQPAMPQAVLEWRYGRAIQAGESSWAHYTPKDYLNFFVRVEIDAAAVDEQEEGEDPSPPGEPLVWVGMIQEVHDAREGAVTIAGGRVLTGKQLLIAFGMEVLLDRKRLLTSVVHDQHADPHDELVIKRAIPFNDENHRHTKAQEQQGAGAGKIRDAFRNRSAMRGDQDAYIFTDDQVAARPWSTLDIVEYVLAYHAPSNAAGDVFIPWGLSATAKAMLPNWDAPRKEFHGQTLLAILNELIDRRRILGWYTTIEETPPGGEEDEEEDEEEEASPGGTANRVLIHVVPFSNTSIEMPAGGIQPPNPIVHDNLDYDLANDVEFAPLKESASHVVEQVVVLGDRIRSCFSLSYLDSTLKADWTSDEQLSYATAADFTDGDVSDQELVNTDARRRDELKRVYSSFIMPTDWNGLVGNGVGSAGDGSPFLPDELNDAESDGPEEFYWPGLRFLDHLPFKDTETSSHSTEYLKPICLFLVHPGDSFPTDRYQHAEKLAIAAAIEGEGDGAGMRWSASCRMSEVQPGVIVEVHGGPQHILAETDFHSEYDWDRLPELDWKDNMIVTVNLVTDRHVTAEWPPGEQVADTDVTRRVEIDLGSRAQLWYVCPGTVKGIDANGYLDRVDDALYVIDDRPKMKDLARLAYDWYQVPRRALRMDLRQITDLLSVGEYVATIGSGATLKQVNSVITSVCWDLDIGRTIINTDFGELDFAQLL